MKDRWARRLYKDSVILIGLPDHITCGFLHETGSSYTLEYFDPAGKDGDRASIKKLRLVFIPISISFKSLKFGVILDSVTMILLGRKLCKKMGARNTTKKIEKES